MKDINLNSSILGYKNLRAETMKNSGEGITKRLLEKYKPKNLYGIENKNYKSNQIGAI